MAPTRCGVILAATLLASACSGGGEARPATTPVAPTTTVASTAAATPSSVPTPAAGAQLPAPRGALAFYRPPAELHGLPGDVVWARERAAPAGAKAWSVLYLTQDEAGRLVAASGVVVAPLGPAPTGGRPVVAWAHGTVGSADRCAPSRQGTLDIPSMAALLEEGYVVTAPDYPGLGTPGPQRYLDGGSEGRSVLDAARAAARLTETGAGPDVVVWGHSQGGHAALFAAQLAAVHAPELRLRGVAVAAPVTRVSDLVELAGRIPVLGAFYLMAAAGLVDAHPDLDAGLLLSPAGSELLGRVEQDCLAALFAAVVVRNEPVGTGESLAGTPWAGAVAAADLGAGPLPVPVLVTQGGRDPLVLPAVTEAAVQERCALGDTVELRRYPDADHATVVEASGRDTVAFFADRLDDEPPTATC